MLITYRAKDIDGPEFASYYYMSEAFGSWTKRPLVQVMVDGSSTGKLQGANPDAPLSQALNCGETVYLVGKDPVMNVDRYVPYTLSQINARFSDFLDFCRDTKSNNHCVGSDVNLAGEKILQERDSVGAEYADVFIQWLMYSEVPFG